MEIREMNEAQLKAHLHLLLGQGNPGGVLVGGCTSYDGHGYATGDHLDAIYASECIFRLWWREKGMKATALDFIAEFVKDKYSASLFSFILGACKKTGLTEKDWEEIGAAYKAATASFSG